MAELAEQGDRDAAVLLSRSTRFRCTWATAAAEPSRSRSRSRHAGINLPSGAGLTRDDVAYVGAAIREAIR